MISILLNYTQNYHSLKIKPKGKLCYGVQDLAKN